jgi:hypothetical protein
LERRDLVVPTKQVAPGNKFLEEGGISQPELRPTLHLGVKKANVQFKSSIPVAGKVEITPKGFTLGALIEFFSICPKLLINAELYDLVLAPRLQKKYTINFGKPICNPWGQCPSIYWPCLPRQGYCG